MLVMFGLYCIYMATSPESGPTLGDEGVHLFSRVGGSGCSLCSCLCLGGHVLVTVLRFT